MPALTIAHEAAETGVMANDDPKKAKTKWSAKGHRLDVATWPESLMLTCEVEAMSGDGRGEKMIFHAGRVVVLPATPRPDAERFVAHCFSFYEDEELTEIARGEVRSFYASLKDASTPTPSAPPIGGRGGPN